jgi:hypothetical protein
MNEHGDKRPILPNTLDAEAYWCAYCKRWVECAPVIGALEFVILHPDRPHLKK